MITAKIIYRDGHTYIRLREEKFTMIEIIDLRAESNTAAARLLEALRHDTANIVVERE